MNLILIKTIMEQDFFAIFESYFLKSSIQSSKKPIFVISHKNFMLLQSSECGLLVVKQNVHKIRN